MKSRTKFRGKCLLYFVQKIHWERMVLVAISDDESIFALNCWETLNMIDLCFRVLMPNGLMKKFPDNNLQLMVQSGAKGSTVSIFIIMLCIFNIRYNWSWIGLNDRF